MTDIAPKLLENIQERFDFLLESNYRLKKLYEQAENGTATYKEANKFALEVGNALAKAYKSELSSDVLPDGKMYYNIAQKIFDDTLKNNHRIVADYCENVQKSLNEKAGISLKAQRPDLDEDRVKGFSELASNADKYDDVAASVEESAINFTQNVVNDFIKKNAEFQYDAGFKAKVIRDSSSDCCSWCDNLVGEYAYPNVPKEVYQRHSYCRCTVEYEPVKGKRQNVHTKEWKNRNESDIINSRKGLKMNLQFFSKENAETEYVRKHVIPNMDTQHIVARQDIHRQGTKMYKERQEILSNKGEYGPPYLTIDDKKIIELVNKYKGTGKIHLTKNMEWDHKELIYKNDEIVGICVNNITGKAVPTSVFKIHYADAGIHIVPDYPSKKERRI